jgi:4-amino-4-deoxy-L-arabinose transferase-like glycosyltransferase
MIAGVSEDFTTHQGTAASSVPLRSGAGVVALALLLAVAVRTPYFLQADFPFNDGGLFYVMVEDVRVNGLLVPAFTSFNGGAIPFCYPPLGMLLAALLANLGVSVLWSLRFLPLLANLATVAAFCGLARQVLGRGSAARLAALLFPLLPFSYQWVMMGAGLTRSLGFLFATAAAWAAHRAFVNGSRRAALATAVTLAGALLSHPEAGVFAAVTVAAIWVVLDRSRQGLVRLAAIAAAAAALSSPWWATVLARHGAGPFLGAASTSEWSLESVQAVAIFVVTAEPFLSLLGVLAVIGFFADAARGRAFLPIWAALTLFAVPRSGHTPVTLPVALAAGLALAGVVLPGLALPAAGARGGDSDDARRRGATRLRLVQVAAAGWVVAYALMSNWLLFATGRHDLVALSADERQALSWIAESTPPASSFAVLTPSHEWAVDATSEWFPALAARRSVLTVQGSEWLPAAEHRRLLRRYEASKACNSAGIACLEGVLAADGVTASHVYVSKAGRGPHSAVAVYRELHAAQRFQVVFENAGAAVFQRRR